MRIQILTLPSVVVGENVEEPFALIVDQCGPVTVPASNDAEIWQRFKQDCGARAILVTDETVEIVDPYLQHVADADHFDDPDALGKNLEERERLLKRVRENAGFGSVS
ncbi:hypothetical protein [Streptosporangium sp. NPDC051022]|uniref:hypothetical protein n=1 Tax=Streptosporangium sp. NPDC051022 TaxID=3155752 RepID=UPI00343CFB6F